MNRNQSLRLKRGFNPGPDKHGRHPWDGIFVAHADGTFSCGRCVPDGIDPADASVEVWDVGSHGWTAPVVCKGCRLSIQVYVDEGVPQGWPLAPSSLQGARVAYAFKVLGRELLAGAANAIAQASRLYWSGPASKRMPAVGQLSAGSPRTEVLRWLQWNDSNGIYTDEMQEPGDAPLTLDEAWDLLCEVLAEVPGTIARLPR